MQFFEAPSNICLTDDFVINKSESVKRNAL